MRIARSTIAFLIAFVLVCLPVFAVDDMFNTDGSINEETVYGGVRFALPDYYKLSSEASAMRNFTADDGKTTLRIIWADTSTEDDSELPSDLSKLKSSAEQLIKDFMGGTKPSKESYSETTLFGYDSISYFAQLDNVLKFYFTITYLPDINSVVVTYLGVPDDDTATEYETDYANMLKNAYVDGPTQSVVEKTPEEPTDTNAGTNNGTDWEKYGDAWSDLGDAFESLENEDIGGYFDALGDAYQKLGELSEGY